MQHSAVDLENYARLYTEDRLRVAGQSRRANEVVTGPSWLERAVARTQSWFASTPRNHARRALAESQPVQLEPVSRKPQAASADPYAGMIVLVRGPRADAA